MADLTGKTLGKYRLVERLGRGGMAEVYRAYQPGLDRYVAVKLMHGYLAEDEDFVERFQREAKAVASLHHPNIVQVHDFDVENDVYYMVQEYIEGGTLKARLEAARQGGEILPLEETLRVLTAICSAVDYAHARGRIHRDIKPDNIMFDATDRPVLTDFGIASIVGGTRLTATGAMVGTPAYMSPEQGRGDRGDVRSDIYSLGVVLYEMVTGSVPFDADTPFAVVLKHLNEPLPLPRTLNPGVSLGLEGVMLKALAKDPDDRYQRAADLAEALQETVHEEGSLRKVGRPDGQELAPAETARAPTGSVVAQSSSALTRPHAAEVTAPTALQRPPQGQTRRVRLSPWGLAGVGLLLLISALVITPWILGQRSERPEDMAATTPAGRHTTAQVVAPEVANLIEAGNGILGSECDGDIAEAQSLFDRAIQQDESAVGAYIGRAQAWWCSGDNTAAVADLDRAIELDPASAVAHLWRGRLAMEEERAEESLVDLARAIGLDPTYAEAYHWRALVYMWYLEDWEQAFADLSRAIDLDPGYALAYLYRGQVQWGEREDAEEALADYSWFVELQPDSPDGYAGRGEIYLYGLGDYDRAVTEYSLAIERDPGYANFYIQRAHAHSMLQSYERAIDDLTRAIEREPQAQTYFYRSVAFLSAGQHSAALDDLDKVLLLGWEGKGAAYYVQGRTYYGLGRYAEAIVAYDRAAEHNWEDALWPYFVDSHLLLDRALAYYGMGQFARALEDLTRLIDEREEWFRPYYERAAIYGAIGEDARALSDLRRAWEYAPDDGWRDRIEDEIETLRTD